MKFSSRSLCPASDFQVVLLSSGIDSKNWRNTRRTQNKLPQGATLLVYDRRTEWAESAHPAGLKHLQLFSKQSTLCICRNKHCAVFSTKIMHVWSTWFAASFKNTLPHLDVNGIRQGSLYLKTRPEAFPEVFLLTKAWCWAQPGWELRAVHSSPKSGLIFTSVDPRYTKRWLKTSIRNVKFKARENNSLYDKDIAMPGGKAWF